MRGNAGCVEILYFDWLHLPSFLVKKAYLRLLLIMVIFNVQEIELIIKFVKTNSFVLSL